MENPHPVCWTNCSVCGHAVVVYSNGRLYHDDDGTPDSEYDHAPVKYLAPFKVGDTWEKLAHCIAFDLSREAAAIQRLEREAERVKPSIGDPGSGPWS